MRAWLHFGAAFLVGSSVSPQLSAEPQPNDPLRGAPQASSAALPPAPVGEGPATESPAAASPVSANPSGRTSGEPPSGKPPSSEPIRSDWQHLELALAQPEQRPSPEPRARPGADNLTLESVLRSTLEAHPKALIAELSLAEADGNLLAARGEFDLKAVGSAEAAPLGYYSTTLGAFGLSQPTPLYGLELKAAYKNGSDFPVYDGKYVTSTAGDIAFGLVLPLLRDGAIDQRRLANVQARLQKTIAEESVKLARAELLGSATAAYYKWLLTQQKQRVYEDLVRLAEERQAYLNEQVSLGQIAAIELVDNGRLLDMRRGSLLELELAVRREALNLSLYVRVNGRPLEPSAPSPRAPSDPTLRGPGGAMRPSGASNASSAALLREVLPLVTAQSLARSDPTILDTPALRIQSLYVDAVRQDLRHAQNQTLPKLDVELGVQQELGEPRVYGEMYETHNETRAFGRLTFALDVQRRKARGKVAALRAKQQILEQKLALGRDMLAQQFAGLEATLANAAERARLAQRAVEGAKVMAGAERERLELGQSSVLAVNLREEAQRNAELSEIEAHLSFHLAWAEYQAALGRHRVEDYILLPAPAAPSPP